MSPVGKHYDKARYNCAHFVADWYHDRLGITIPTDEVFSLAFTRWMRKHFISSSIPVNDCLVLMTCADGLHVGVYSDYGVYHNYQAGRAHGAVVHWDIGVIHRHYNEVSYWIWSPSDIIKTQQQDNSLFISTSE